MTESNTAITAYLQAHHGSAARPIAVHPHEGGEQGYSGAVLRYYDVAYSDDGAARQTTLVIKDAPLVERRTLAWLGEQGLAVPANHSADLTTAASAPVCMEYAGDPPAEENRAAAVARALAGIHHAALGRRAALPWLPPADPAFFANRLIDSCWRGPWRRLATGEVISIGMGISSPTPRRTRRSRRHSARSTRNSK